ncbi:DUF3095 family protein [Roseibium sp. CAU 1637]|uniref:DUF3095 family protein n=1 Tax=Roseibium limicola TaxID=2816037 RepID=A0A939EMW6_9HYPH|nr:DUF3095 family protein [Roseibium limicola]MBO0345494.1 DUF3095 family protein [Roseibium limicola]
MTDQADTFYKNLPSFRDFDQVGDLAAYQPVPDDWVVLAADIVQSRKAMADGKSKEVNLVGAGVIASVVNVLDRDRIPFIFGGDGAMILVPGADAAVGGQALAGMAQLARDQQGLTLRTAAIPLKVLRERGTDVRLRKYELNPGNYLAMAIGGGLDLADEILKSPENAETFAIDTTAPPVPDLTGLSCRWEQLPSEHGRIVSLIVRPTKGAGEEQVLTDIRKELRRLIGQDVFSDEEEGRFIFPRRLRFRFPPSGLGREIRLVGASRGRLKTALGSVFECLAFLYAYTTGRTVGPLQPARYLDEICRQTDHRKLDDSLRLVLDMSAGQVAALRVYLEQARDRGALSFGLHEADTAMMTCFVSDLSAGQHLHFIDGHGGGLSAAATAMNSAA